MNKIIEKISSKKILWLYSIFIIVVFIFGAPIVRDRYFKKEDYLRERFYAVFLNNNQVYFGKIDKIDRFGILLTDVYYLKNSVENVNEGGPIQLIKLGSEIHGPEDFLKINKDSIVFYELLRRDSSLVQSIERSKEINNIN